MFSAGNEEAVSENGLAAASKIVEAFYQKVNLDPNTNRLKLPSGMGWSIKRGSALMYILLAKVQDIDTIRVAAPILHLPQENLLPLYRRMLELNFHTLNCAFAINKDLIVVVSERPVGGLDLLEFENMILQTGHVADNYDNKLADEFGAKLYTG